MNRTIDHGTLGGWVDRPSAVRDSLALVPRPLFCTESSPIRGSGNGRTVLLYRAWADVNANAYPEYPAQQVGDCIGHAFAHAVDLLAAVQIVKRGRPESFKLTAAESIYAAARVAIGGLGPDDPDGAVGAWAARAVTDHGTLSRDVLGPYDGQRSRLWGGTGVPEVWAKPASGHRVHTTSLVRTYQELADSVANGYPVAVCSNVGFSTARDVDGFCAAEGAWAHCMVVVGVRADHRPGACVLQSWGPGVPAGPLAHDQPGQSFWVDRDVVDGMLACGDSWALSSFDGYPAQALPASWSYDGFA